MVECLALVFLHFNVFLNLLQIEFCDEGVDVVENWLYICFLVTENERFCVEEVVTDDLLMSVDVSFIDNFRLKLLYLLLSFLEEKKGVVL